MIEKESAKLPLNAGSEGFLTDHIFVFNHSRHSTHAEITTARDIVKLVIKDIFSGLSQ